MVSLSASAPAAAATRPPATLPHPGRPGQLLPGWQLGSLRLSLGLQPACRAPAAGALLLIPVGQPLNLHQETLPRILYPPADLLYLPSTDAGLRAAPFDGWRLELDVQQLCRLAAELTEHRLSPARFRRQLEQGQPLQLGSSATLQQQGQLELLELDRMIQRLVVLLLCGPMIHAARQRSGLGAEQRNRVIDELLTWIQEHLHQPLQLQDLVRQSGYSQRSLRNFFQERFGCGPVHWIRSQRLQLARERLLSPRPDDSVSSIAAELGYEHHSKFSRDVQKAFGSPPSALLREGRRHHGLD
jgi:AraC-like DNA-binding protein